MTAREGILTGDQVPRAEASCGTVAGTGARLWLLPDVVRLCSLPAPSSATVSLGRRTVAAGAAVVMTTPAARGRAPVDDDVGENETTTMTSPCALGATPLHVSDE